jgi:hypothetical protein
VLAAAAGAGRESLRAQVRDLVAAVLPASAAAGQLDAALAQRAQQPPDAGPASQRPAQQVQVRGTMQLTAK